MFVGAVGRSDEWEDASIDQFAFAGRCTSSRTSQQTRPGERPTRRGFLWSDRMTVAELIRLLSGFEPDRIVVMAKDAEGNNYSPLHGMWAGKYRAETTWYGPVGLEGIDEEMMQQGYTDEDVMTDGEKALILTPVN